MSDFGPNVGIEFVETASGHVAIQISDPVVAERLAKAGGRALQLALKISIPRLQDFLRSAVHVAEISSGTVSWKPNLAAAPMPPGGSGIARSL